MALETWVTFIICILLTFIVNIICDLARVSHKKNDSESVVNISRVLSMPVRRPETQRIRQRSARSSVRRSSIVVRTPDTFPRCPQCRARNRTGESQKVFWDPANTRFKCNNGHFFNA